MLDLYHPGASPLHRARAGLKLLALLFLSTLIFALATLPTLPIVLGLIGLGYGIAALPARLIWRQLRPVLWILAILFAVQLWLNDLAMAGFIVLRLVALLLLAGLFTLTTRSSDIIDAITKGLAVLRPIGVNPAKVGLAFSLALRFIPVLSQATKEVREAQIARGLDRNIIAMAVPVFVRTLKMADDIADAIDARGFDPR